MAAEGHRERKKLANHRALSHAALVLAAERGIDNVTVDEIAEAAGLSPRTFFNYFPTKEAAFVGDDVERGDQFVAAVRAAPEGAPLWDLLRRVAVETIGHSDLSAEDQALKEQLVLKDPTYFTQTLATLGRLEQSLAVELARRLPDADPLTPRLLTQATTAAVKSATETWFTTDPGNPDALVNLLEDAFAVLAPALSEL